ncbi:MAG TPA: hypothetical protein VH913_18280 [Hyphomicrobiaceae bacterium]
MRLSSEVSGYRYADSAPCCAHDYLLPAVRRELAAFFARRENGRVFDLGCGNGSELDNHFTALWDHGHFKFWSVRTLGELLRDSNFGDIRFLRVGRVPALAKSMIAVARKSDIRAGYR